jgi:hypothetical protein
MEATATVAGGTFDFQVVETPNRLGEVFQVDDVAAYRVPSPGTVVVAGGNADARSEPAPVEAPLVFGARLHPNPPGVGATISLVTTRSGFARVQVYDTQGRVVRHLLDESALPAGRHALRFQTKSGGVRLGPGMYFYLVQAAEGRISGKFAILE